MLVRVESRFSQFRVWFPGMRVRNWSSPSGRQFVGSVPLILLIFLGVAIVGAVAPVWAGWLLAGMLACVVTMFGVGMLVHGEVDLFVIGWIFLFPAGYYWLSFPLEKPVFTLDRFIVAGWLGARERTVLIEQQLRFDRPDHANPPPFLTGGDRQTLPERPASTALRGVPVRS